MGANQVTWCCDKGNIADTQKTNRKTDLILINNTIGKEMLPLVTECNVTNEQRIQWEMPEKQKTQEKQEKTEKRKKKRWTKKMILIYSCRFRWGKPRP